VSVKFTSAYSKIFKAFFPSPFTIAILLTLVVFALAFFVTSPKTDNHAEEILLYWRDGLWNKNGFEFTLQMMLMLVLGHAIALSKSVQRFVASTLKYCTNHTSAVLITLVFTLLVSYINWGLGLIFGAILARQIGEHAARNNIPINYALVGASGYIGLMVWHGGLSGSAPLKASEPNALSSMISNPDLTSNISAVGVSETLGSAMNLTSVALVFILIPLLGWMLAKKSKTIAAPDFLYVKPTLKTEHESAEGAERIDRSFWFGRVVSLLLIVLIYFDLQEKWANHQSIITPNFVNLSLLAIALLLHRSLSDFVTACETAMSGATGILIQFPLYFGIMEVMRQTGLLQQITQFFVENSTKNTFPIYTFFSAGLINLFVPSGGGQWSVQGPIIVETCLQQGWNLPKSIMALSYGDQLTNMLQPFWAIPLLGITGLKAQHILPYTLLFLLAGVLIFGGVLLIF
jgi:short-chain fatty acids transporter